MRRTDFNGRPTPQVRLLREALGVDEIGIGDLILCEVLQGFRDDREFNIAREALLSLRVFPMVGSVLAEKRRGTSVPFVVVA